MTVRVERTFEFEAPPERVWTFISDPDRRAAAISVVRDWERVDGETIWRLALPIPFAGDAFAVRTRDVDRVENERVSFVGRSSVMRVRGEHELRPVDGRTRLVNRFVVEGRLPGVETFFKRNLDGELDNLRDALERYLAGEE